MDRARDPIDDGHVGIVSQEEAQQRRFLEAGSGRSQGESGFKPSTEGQRLRNDIFTRAIAAAEESKKSAFESIDIASASVEHIPDEFANLPGKIQQWADWLQTKKGHR